MPHVNDDKLCALLQLTGETTGAIDGLENRWLASEVGVEGSNADLWELYLDLNGVPPGALSDRYAIWMVSLGLTAGTLDGLWHELWHELCGSGTPPPPALPSAIIDFVASDDQHGQITMTWTHATGNPVPQHNLFSGVNPIIENITSPYVHVVGEGTALLHVKAVNSQGSVDSNEDQGTSLPAISGFGPGFGPGYD